MKWPVPKWVKYLLVAILLVLALCVGWWLRGPPKGAKEVLEFFASFAPKLSTSRDWEALVVERGKATISGQEMPVVTVKNIRPLLEGDDLLAAMHLNVTNTRGQGVLKSVVWSHKANKALAFDWLTGKVTGNAKPSQEVPFFLGPEGKPFREKYSGNYYIAAPPESSRQCKLTIGTPAGQRTHSWDRPSSLIGSYYYRSYRYCVIPERGNVSKRIEGLVLIDLDKLEVAGLVPLPTQVGRYPPLFVLDPTTDLLLCFDLDVAWVVCVDLRSGIDQKLKPWPPPWPHPALGEWHGNDAAERGWLSQHFDPKNPPPKPADYP